MNILIIDDEKSVCEYFIQIASAKGHDRIETAGTGEAALSKVIRTPYDLITVDLEMPGVNGIGMLRNMCPHAIIAVISGFIPDDVSDEVVGCVDVLIDKPINVDTFSKLLEGAEQIVRTMGEIRQLGRATPQTSN